MAGRSISPTSSAESTSTARAAGMVLRKRLTSTSTTTLNRPTSKVGTWVVGSLVMISISLGMIRLAVI